MNYTPVAHAESLRIGTIDFISPNEVKAFLDIEAPDLIALNAGDVRPFPRINGYVLMPVDGGYLVGQIEWMTIEHSAFPKRKGMQDSGLIDLPYPLRKMSLNPLGTLRKEIDSEVTEPGENYLFQRGADALPSVGSPVLLPTKKQLLSIIESGAQRRVHIGTSPLAANATVSVDPDRLFGRHLAVLGNTGSGKSCSVAGLIRWSLEAAKAKCQGKGRPNARFIVLDPNGEYTRAFSNTGVDIETRIFMVRPEEKESALKVPLWFWNSAEWSSFTQASAKTQRPLLKRALREVKAGRIGVENPAEEEQKLALRRYLSSTLISIQHEVRTGTIRTEATKFGFLLKTIHHDLEERNRTLPDYSLENICSAIFQALDDTFHTFEKDGENIEYYRAFTEQLISPISASLRSSLESLGGIIYQQGPDEDIPLRFRGVELADHLEILSVQENVSQHLDFLISRIRTFLSDPRIRSVIDDSEDTDLEQWLGNYMGDGNGNKGQLTILDLSLVPTEIIHIITAVTARMIFESLQRYKKLNKVTLPTVLVMEEAHTFVKRYRDDVENYDAASVCCQVFERIAREGRKFGLGLVLSSQRPSELSPTVLSQCNTFLLHRISNDRDQELVGRLVPDNLRGLLRELPSLPSQHAILLGWASELPVLVKVNKLPELQQPHSDDPDYWDVWTGMNSDGNEVTREINWKNVADNWQGVDNQTADEDQA